ncbi:MAG: hypothetical protein Phyf2KO_06560 [Phycisphaerales bacterium]
MIDVMLIALGTYFVIGLAFAVVVAAGPIKTVDSVVADSPMSFRLLVIPGMATLWPIMVGKLLATKTARRES